MTEIAFDVIEPDTEVGSVTIPSVEIDLSLATPEVSSVLVLGPAGPSGPAGGTAVIRTAESLSGHIVVTTNDLGKLIPADCTDTTHLNRDMGLTTGAWGADVDATITFVGVVEEPTWSWTIGDPVYLGASGLLTQTVPPGASFILIVGYPLSTTSLSFKPKMPITISS